MRNDTIEQHYQGPQGDTTYNESTYYTASHTAAYIPPVSTTAPRGVNPLILELVLSFLGIFGIGWLLARRPLPGILLLLGSIFLYWPIMILGTIFTFGIGLICLGPLAMAAILLNALLLSRVLRKRYYQRYPRFPM
ncbi:hypothetical protein [Thermosporothrix hazakensis]|jgi:hypothetical protein|nr:hypothetical protein [Thermosporothrix hazakensis]BBH90950.1 hypothetical protein KTC_57010 [Thermosporothrix sp. COM3]GCE49000.1 hypothetical protein KTH_38690 [Thermosporothrix hazakensis]